MRRFKNIEKTNKDEYVITTESLPKDLNFMPTLGNGHLGYTVFCDSIYMNGIYNGASGNSRRARIPNWFNLNVSIDSKKKVKDAAVIIRNFEMNLKDGYFRWQQSMPTLGGLKIEQRTYPHRFYNRALIYELLVQRTETKEPLTLILTQTPGKKSEDFDFTHLEGFDDWKVLTGITQIAEDEKFQTELKTIYVYLSDDLKHGKLLKMAAGKKELYYRFVLTADEVSEKAELEMKTVLDLKPAKMFEMHFKEWHNFWETFHIHIDGNIELAQIINAGLFYMASSLPSQNSFQPNNFFYGLSPTGLGRGKKKEDYLGHNFWDTEIWMLPVVTQLSSNWTEDLLNYRRHMLKAAQFHAKQTNYEGARYPWESAYTGTEVTQPDYPEVAEYEVHISADIILGIKHFFSVTNDEKWLGRYGHFLIWGIARFLKSRAKYNPKTKKYHIKDVMGPDEYHAKVTDSVYTNISFKLALEFACYVYNYLTGTKSPPRDWKDVAKNMYIPYDSQKDYHPEYENYQIGEIVKQADVILLGYPLNFQMNDSTRFNDLVIYDSATHESGPAMTWSMFAINYLDINEFKNADYYFKKSYRNYVRQEFKVWGEYTIGKKGAVNFLTGIGGFLQLIINGYAGVRFDHRDGSAIMEIRKSRKIPNTNGFKIQGLFFANARFNLSVDSNGGTNLICTSLGDKNIEITFRNKTQKIKKGFKIDLYGEPAILKTV